MQILKYTALFLSLIFFSPSGFTSDAFPVCSELKSRVDFWKKVYTEIHSYEAFLHDVTNPSIIYEKVSYKGLSRRSKRRLIRREAKKIKRLLRSIAKKKQQNLTGEESLLLSKIGNVTNSKLRKMSRNIRSQQGMLDRYYAGLLRSYKFLPQIRKIFNEMELPEELSFLPHVESSFNHKAYSKVGAAGMWQFMRATARLYGLKMNYVMDERRDPIRSARAAARLLKDNYRQIQSWPLAVTAYNHGLASMKRAVRKVGTSNFCEIVKKYKGRRFGFASKNFYATFLASVEISKEPEKYFQNIKKAAPTYTSTIVLPKAMPLKTAAKTLNLPHKLVKELNPAIRRSAYKRNLYLPKGTRLNVPQVSANTLAEYKSELQSKKVAKLKIPKSFSHRVRRGESLYSISKYYRVSLNDIILLNNIENPRRIYRGMKIKIPGQDSAREIAKLKVEEPEESPSKGATLSKAPSSKETVAFYPLPGPRDSREEVQDNISTELSNWLKKIGPKKNKKDLAKNTAARSTSSLSAAPKIFPLDGPTISPNEYNFLVKKKRKDVYEIIVEPEETLTHYSDWSLVRMHKIRALNRLGRRGSIRLGQRILLPLDKKKLLRFNAERINYHMALEEDFYENFKFSTTKNYKVRRGDTVSSIEKKFETPFWIIRKYQKDPSPLKLIAGNHLVIPIFEEKTKTIE